MNGNIQYLLLCFFAALVYCGYTVAAAQDCNISVTNSNSSSNETLVAIFNGGDSLTSYPLQQTKLAKGKNWNTRCAGGTQNRRRIQWVTEAFRNRTHAKRHVAYKAVDVACGSSYEITTETSGLKNP